MRKMKYKIVYYKETMVSTLNILLKKSEDSPLPYCKTGAELDWVTL
jgi:hypothetical protein